MTLDCMACGACCAVEPAACTEQEAAGIPAVMVEAGPLGRFVRQEAGRCSALLGYMGVSVACVIYDSRPRCCRVFERGSAECLEARRRKGLEAA